jgi:hypothetical protein
MGDSSGRIYNIISVVFLFLTIVVLVLGIMRMLQPAPRTNVVVSVPTAAILPSATPSFTPSVTLPATWTLTPTFTTTPTPTETLVPTATASLTITATLTQTPTLTATVPPSMTPTVTLTTTQANTPLPPAAPPTETPGPSPFPFRLRNNQVAFTSNFANTAGCQWQGFGGAAFDLSGAPLNGIRVHIYDGQAVELYTASGTNTLYGPGGWEMQVATTINAQTYFIELQASDGTIISPTVQVTFPGSCEGNLAVVNFEQTRPF